MNISLKQNIHKFHSAILSACPDKGLPNVDDIGKPTLAKASQPLMVPTAAALKMGVGFPLNNITAGRIDTGRVLSSQATKQGKIAFTNFLINYINFLLYLRTAAQ